RVTRANAVTARSGLGYDGIDPRVGVPSSDRTAKDSGTPSTARNVETTGFVWSSPSPTTWRTASAYGAASCATGGAHKTTSASTSGLLTASRTAAPNSSGPACGPTSTGSNATVRPRAMAVSAASCPTAVELPTIATLGPFGSGWWAN